MLSIHDFIFFLTLLTTLGCWLMTGLFFVFSNFVMKSLSRLDPPAGISAMQWINKDIINPWFAVLFFGTALTSALAIGYSLIRWNEPGAIYLFIGGTTYLIGGFLITMIVNVPKNDNLEKIQGADPESENLWREYVSSWTAWNHVRTVMSLIATVSFIIALSY